MSVEFIHFKCFKIFAAARQHLFLSYICLSNRLFFWVIAGRDLVDWLMEHVHGITDRKAARSFASNLLAEGHIRHVVNKLTFTEKCYYVFEGKCKSVSAIISNMSVSQIVYVCKVQVPMLTFDSSSKQWLSFYAGVFRLNIVGTSQKQIGFFTGQGRSRSDDRGYIREFTSTSSHFTFKNA